MYTFERNWYIRYLCVSEYITTRLQTSSISFRFSKNETELSLSDRFSISHARYRRGRHPIYIYIYIETCNKCSPYKCACVLRLFFSAPPLDFLLLSVYILCRAGHNKVQGLPKPFSLNGNPFKQITLRFACVCLYGYNILYTYYNMYYNNELCYVILYYTHNSFKTFIICVFACSFYNCALYINAYPRNVNR